MIYQIFLLIKIKKNIASVTTKENCTTTPQIFGNVI
jgi:hypothetical protein